jgi:FlaA1/EpsC-like NDP-sugar epimerase
MTTTRSAARGGSGKPIVDTFWVLASWFSAYGLYTLLASPDELLVLPKLGPYALASVAVALASLALGSAFGLYRAGSPLISLRVVAAVVLVRALELAALVAIVAELGTDTCATAILLLHSVLACIAVLGWRIFLRLLAPYGFDFSRLPLGRRLSAHALQVAVRESGVRARSGEETRALPRSKSR